MKRGALKPGKPLQRTQPMPRTGTLSASSFQRTRKAPKMKSRGMKGRPPTADEQRFMDAVAGLGCIACRKDGIENSLISIHHIQGRTAPGAHFLVLPLCGPHHQQDDSDPMGRVSLHGSREQFEARYGTERELLAEAKERLGVA